MPLDLSVIAAAASVPLALACGLSLFLVTLIPYSPSHTSPAHPCVAPCLAIIRAALAILTLIVVAAFVVLLQGNFPMTSQSKNLLAIALIASTVLAPGLAQPHLLAILLITITLHGGLLSLILAFTPTQHPSIILSFANVCSALWLPAALASITIARIRHQNPSDYASSQKYLLLILIPLILIRAAFSFLPPMDATPLTMASLQLPIALGICACLLPYGKLSPFSTTAILAIITFCAFGTLPVLTLGTLTPPGLTTFAP